MKQFGFLAIWTAGWLCGIIWTDGQQLQIDKVNARVDHAYQRDEDYQKLAINREITIADRLDMALEYEKQRQVKQ